MNISKGRLKYLSDGLFKSNSQLKHGLQNQIADNRQNGSSRQGNNPSKADRFHQFPVGIAVNQADTQNCTYQDMGTGNRQAHK